MRISDWSSDVCSSDLDYLIVERDGAQLHFWLCTERHVAENTSCYIRTGDCQALYREFCQRGLVLDAPVMQPLGMQELYVIDAHGHLLKFGEHTYGKSVASGKRLQERVDCGGPR